MTNPKTKKPRVWMRWALKLSSGVILIYTNKSQIGRLEDGEELLRVTITETPKRRRKV